VRRLRIEEAARRFAAGAVPLVEVALDAGFADQAHFSRVFKQVTGLTPGEYRKMFISR
jgi:AraC family transcriptional regulator